MEISNAMTREPADEDSRITSMRMLVMDCLVMAFDIDELMRGED